jgi:hypothetical protein
MRIDALDQVYEKCNGTGHVKVKNEVDIELINSLAKVAKNGLDFIRYKAEGIKRDSPHWTFVFRDYYEALRTLIEAYLLFDRIEIDNHQCKNAYICFKHPELELDWEFLETIRLKRNAINYRGQMLKYDDWKSFELKFDLHINAMNAEIEKKLGQA